MWLKSEFTEFRRGCEPSKITGKTLFQMMKEISKNQFTKRNWLSFFAERKKFFPLAIFFLVPFLSSCITRTEKHGYMFEMSDSHLLEPGISNRQHVTKIMGSPTLISDFGSDELWIYYAEKTESALFFKPKITAREVVAITFDNGNIAKKIERLDLADEEKNLQFSLNETPVPEHKVGFLKSLFSNVGQIRPQ